MPKNTLVDLHCGPFRRQALKAAVIALNLRLDLEEPRGKFGPEQGLLSLIQERCLSWFNTLPVCRVVCPLDTD